MKTDPANTIVHKELLEACKKDDFKAQMKVYKLYYKTMFNISLRIVGDRMEAEDIMQESFLTAFNHLKTTDLTMSFGGWMKRIVINRSLDAVKKRHLQFSQVDEIPDTGSMHASTWEEDNNVEEKVSMVKRALEKLPEKYRIVLSLNLFEGYDHDEIGEILGIQPSTSRAQLSRGKQKLLQLIG